MNHWPAPTGLLLRLWFQRKKTTQLFGHPDFWNPLKTAPLMARWGLRFIERQYQLLAKLVIDNTILVASPGVLAAGLVHEKQGARW